MPAALIPRPGSEVGPCDKSASCGHADCKQTVADAASICPKCNAPIGYDRPAFYFHGNNPEDRKAWPETAWAAASVVNASGAPLLIVHEECPAAVPAGPSLVIPNLRLAFSDRGQAPGKTACRLCARVVSTRGGAMLSHAKTHVADGKLETLTAREVDGELLTVGYRTPGAVGFFATWTDSQGNERPVPDSAGANRDQILADNLYHMGRTAKKQVRPIGFTLNPARE